VLAGFLAVAVIPAAVGLAELLGAVQLLDAAAAIPVAILCGIVALWLAHGARTRIERTLGRIGGLSAARAGKTLGVIGLCLAVSAAIAVATYYALIRWAE
jgi:hypothetical protein